MTATTRGRYNKGGWSKASSQLALSLFDHSIAPKLGSSRTAMWLSDSDKRKRHHEGDHQMVTTRQGTKTITMPSAPEPISVPEPVTQRKKAEDGRFRLQVDRQTKASYATYESAEAAGLGIKKEHPILQVAIYDVVASVNKIIELP
jgi:hypothetical protein